MNLLAAVSPDYTPFWILAAGVVFVIASIVKFRLHPFLGLTLGAVLVGVLTPTLPDSYSEKQSKLLEELRLDYDADEDGYFNGEEQKSISAADEKRLTLEHLRPDGSINHWGKAVALAMTGFGVLVGKIGFVIAMAAVIGMCMMESGAADKIVRRLMAALGEKRASWAMLLSGFILSIPVFFDTVFFLLIPLARALALRTGKNYTLYVCAICAGGAITHTIVPPTPGPLIIAENIGWPCGEAILAGLLAAVVPVLVAMWYCRRLNASVNVPLRDTRGAPLKELEAIVQKKDCLLYTSDAADE